MTLATVYIIMVCGWSPGMIVERQVDGRAVSVPYFYEYPKPHMMEWVLEGIKESQDANEVFVIPASRECALS